jgi:hypothetical protein
MSIARKPARLEDELSPRFVEKLVRHVTMMFGRVGVPPITAWTLAAMLVIWEIRYEVWLNRLDMEIYMRLETLEKINRACDHYMRWLRLATVCFVTLTLCMAVKVFL